MYAMIYTIHKISVSLFILWYAIKLMGLLLNSAGINGLFAKKPMRILEMVVSAVFFVTGGWMFFQTPEKSMFLYIKLLLVFISIPLAIVGFKRNNKALAVVSVLLLVMSYGLAEMNKKRPNVSESAKTAASGAELFKAANCVACHGEDGKAMIAGAKDLSISKLTDAEAAHIITNGKNAMKGYKKQLSETEINMLVEHVKSLRK